MHNTWLHHHGDGSIHYTHCCAEAVEPLPVFETSPTRRRRLRAGLSAAGTALGLATLVFWVTMLSSPPTSRASITPEGDVCRAAGHTVRVMVDAAAARRARVVTAPGQADFTRALLWTRAAEAVCAAERTREALREFDALERLFVARAGSRREEADD
jgi:hypothetical protein